MFHRRTYVRSLLATSLALQRALNAVGQFDN